MKLNLFSFLSSFIVPLVVSQQQDGRCRLIMHYSEELGSSVYAGQFIAKDALIESNIGVLTFQTAARTALDGYHDNHNGTHYLAFIGGYAMNYNHSPSIKEGRMIKKYYKATQKTALGGGHTTLDTDVKAARDIFPGEQIFHDYGEDWFKNRGWQEISPRNDIGGDYVFMKDVYNSPSRIPGCPTSMAEIRDNGVFAIRDIRYGCVILCLWSFQAVCILAS